MYEQFFERLSESQDHDSKNGCFIKSIPYANVTTCKEIALSSFRGHGQILAYIPTRSFNLLLEYLKTIRNFFPLSWEIEYSSGYNHIFKFKIDNDPRLDVIYDFACFMIKYTFRSFGGLQMWSPSALPLDYFYTYSKDYLSIFYYQWMLGNFNKKLIENNWVYSNGIDLKKISLNTGLFSYLQVNREGMIKDGFDQTFKNPVIAYVDDYHADQPLHSLIMSILSLMNKYSSHYNHFGNWVHNNCRISFVKNWRNHEYMTQDHVRISFTNPN